MLVLTRRENEKILFRYPDGQEILTLNTVVINKAGVVFELLGEATSRIVCGDIETVWLSGEYRPCIYVPIEGSLTLSVERGDIKILVQHMQQTGQHPKVSLGFRAPKLINIIRTEVLERENEEV